MSLTFTNPSALQPTDVNTSYQRLSLVMTLDASNQTARIFGEGPASLDAPIIVPANPTVEQVTVPILMYHRVAPLPQQSTWTSSYGYRIEYGLTVPPDQFAAELDDLSQQGYQVISLTRLADALLDGLPLPTHPVVLTFDDGRQSPYTYAVPELRKHGDTAEFFACSGFVGETNETANHLNVQHYLTWDQVTGLNSQGFWVEDHGQKDQQVLWNLNQTALNVEAGQSAQALSSHTGRDIQFVAYTGALWPYPRANQAGPAQEQLFAALSQLGYVGGVLDTRISSTQESTGQLFQLPRIRVSPGETLAEFNSSLQQSGDVTPGTQTADQTMNRRAPAS